MMESAVSFEVVGQESLWTFSYLTEGSRVCNTDLSNACKAMCWMTSATELTVTSAQYCSDVPTVSEQVQFSFWHDVGKKKHVYEVHRSRKIENTANDYYPPGRGQASVQSGSQRGIKRFMSWSKAKR